MYVAGLASGALQPLDCHIRLVFQSRPPTSKHFEIPDGDLSGGKRYPAFEQPRPLRSLQELFPFFNFSPDKIRTNYLSAVNPEDWKTLINSQALYQSFLLTSLVPGPSLSNTLLLVPEPELELWPPLSGSFLLPSTVTLRVKRVPDI